MKRKVCITIVMLFFMSACSQEDNSDNAGSCCGRDNSFDHTAYENTDIDSYGNFDAMPSGLRREATRNAILFSRSMENISNKGASSSSACAGVKAAGCLLYHCWKPMAACVLDGECRSQLMSLGNCSFKTNDAMMLCYITALSDPCDKMLDMMSCWGESGCMSVPVPDCPLPANRDRIAPVTLADLEGDWYVVRGLSTVYDCWGCQKYSFRQISETVSTYDYTYYPKDVNSPVTIKCTTTAIPFAPGETEIFPGRFRVDYSAYGMPGTDNWFCLAHPDSNYVLIYYCGASALDSYRGGIVLSRTAETVIPLDILMEFENALANAGIPEPVVLGDFCTPDNSACVE
jgi:hypothetical protein